MSWRIGWIVMSACAAAHGQMTFEEAQVRLEQRQAERASVDEATTQPATMPAESEVEALRAEIARLWERIEKLQRENAALRERVAYNEAAAARDANPPETYEGDEGGRFGLSAPRESGGGGGGSVRVKGYHRKDGTYVRPHTRSRPR